VSRGQSKWGPRKGPVPLQSRLVLFQSEVQIEYARSIPNRKQEQLPGHEPSNSWNPAGRSCLELLCSSTARVRSLAGVVAGAVAGVVAKVVAKVVAGVGVVAGVVARVVKIKEPRNKKSPAL
jgi:hypothetical protein